MVRKPRYDSKARRIIETGFIEGRAWCADLARAMSGELVLIKYERNRNDDHFPQRTKELDCEGYIACPPGEDEITDRICFAPVEGSWGQAPSVSILLDRIERFLSCCVDVEHEYLFPLACFVISTWFIERLPIAPYVAVVGLPGSGKSTLLHALSLICRRGMITTDVSSAAFYRACDRMAPTLCIDAAATENKQKLFRLLRSGGIRHALAFHQGQSYGAYGAKVVAWNEMPSDDGFSSRCIVIPMQESSRAVLRTTDPVVLKKATELRANLQMYRIQSYWQPQCQHIPGADQLRSRERDLYESLALPIAKESKDCQRLLEFFTNEENRQREPLPPDQTAILESLFRRIHVQPDQNTYALGELKKDIDGLLAEAGEPFHLNERAISEVLRTLGFRRRKRTNAGYLVLIDRQARQLVHQLSSRYGVQSPSAPEIVIGQCEFCTTESSKPAETSPHSELRDYKQLYQRIQADTGWSNLVLWSPENPPSLPPSVEDLLGPEWRQQGRPSDDSEGSERSEDKSKVTVIDGIDVKPPVLEPNNGAQSDSSERDERKTEAEHTVTEGKQPNGDFSEAGNGRQVEPINTEK